MGFLGGLLKLILPSLEDAVLSKLYDYLTGLMHDRGLIQQGMATQAASETATAARTEAAMGQASADAPVSKSAALAALRAGQG